MTDTAVQLAAIARLDALFRDHGLDYWLFGGWAVDFRLGAVTRDHSDIDVAVWEADSVAVQAALAAQGWRVTSPPDQDGYTTYALRDLNLDLALLARDIHGEYTPTRAGRGEWPPQSFGEDVAELAGTRARVVTAASLLADKTQPRENTESAMKDAADVARLRSILRAV